MICECGNKLLKDAVFCENCGKKINGHKDVKRCNDCGCPLCSDAAFCAFCGKPVASAQDAHSSKQE